MNYFLHQLYSEATHARKFNYNLNFVGRHNPIGCVDCMRSDIGPHGSNSFAVNPLNSLHEPPMHHLDPNKMMFFPSNSYRIAIPYRDTIIRDNIHKGFDVYSHFNEDLYPLLIKTPRNLVQYCNSRHEIPITDLNHISLIKTQPVVVNLNSHAKGAAKKRAKLEKDLLNEQPQDEQVNFEQLTQIYDEMTTKTIKFEPSTQLPKSIQDSNLGSTFTRQENGSTTINGRFIGDNGAISTHQCLVDNNIRPIWEVPNMFSYRYISQTYKSLLDLYHPLSNQSNLNNANHVNNTNNIQAFSNNMGNFFQSHNNSPNTQITNDVATLRNNIIEQWSKMPVSYKAIPVTLGQVLYEWKHLLTRLSMSGRDPEQAKLLSEIYIDINYKYPDDRSQIYLRFDQNDDNFDTEFDQNGISAKHVEDFFQEYNTIGANDSGDNDDINNNDNNNDNNNNDNDFEMSPSASPTTSETASPISANSSATIVSNNIRENATIYEKHPYETQLDPFGLPAWLNSHAKNHKEEFKRFSNISPQFRAKVFPQIIPGYNQNSPLRNDNALTPHEKSLSTNLSPPSSRALTPNDTPSTTRRTRSKVDQNDDTMNINIDETTSATTTKVKRPLLDSPKRSRSNSPLRKAAGNGETEEPLASLFHIKPVAKLPPNCDKVLHINDLLHPLFYIVDGEIEYTEVLGNHDLGELKLFYGD
jgi:hypothetical protein